MTRSTTIHLTNATPWPLQRIGDARARGRWDGEAPPSTLGSGATATFTTVAAGPLGSTEGSVSYSTGRPEDSAILSWSNPYVGRNSYRIDCPARAGQRLGWVCDGAGDESVTDSHVTVVPVRKVTVPGFRPSTAGFRFTNSWPDSPLARLNLRIAEIPIGNASNGLCGGMALAACDWFEARRPIPSSSAAPPEGHPLREYLVARLIDSFDLPGGVVPYVRYMARQYPGDDRAVLASVGGLASRAAVVARQTWPQVKRSIDAGHPCPLGLVMVASDDLADLRHQHQVVAYAYRLQGTKVTMWVYDPNSPGDDRVTIAVDTGRTDRPMTITHRVDAAGPMVCAFVPRYRPKAPPAGAT